MPAPQLIVQFLLQLTVILIACRAVGWLMMRLGQPKVIGEMIAGILLGPSLLGLVAPGLQAALFPPASLGLLSTVSKIGLVLYMFVVGTHVQTNVIRQAFRSAIVISVVGIVVPFVLGAALAIYFHRDGRFFAADVPRTLSLIYLGAAMAVTAFPVLARIIQERGIGGTSLGTLALVAGAAGDAIAWCLLAVVLVSLNPEFDVAGFLGSHAIFVAFVAGVLFSKASLTRQISQRVEWIASTVLVPLFFAVLGLVHASRPALVDGTAGGVDRRHPHRIGGEGRRLLGCRPHDRPAERRGDGDWRAHERARADGAHHAEHRARAGSHHADAVHRDGGHDARDDAGGRTGVRMGVARIQTGGRS